MRDEILDDIKNIALLGQQPRRNVSNPGLGLRLWW